GGLLAPLVETALRVVGDRCRPAVRRPVWPATRPPRRCRPSCATSSPAPDEPTPPVVLLSTRTLTAEHGESVKDLLAPSYHSSPMRHLRHLVRPLGDLADAPCDRFASNLAAAGVDPRIIDRFMSHQTEAVRKRYQHLFPRARRSAIESFS